MASADTSLFFGANQSAKTRRFLAVIFSFIGSLTCLFTGLNALRDNDTSLASVLLLVAGLLAFATSILRSDRLHNLHWLMQHFAVVSIVILGSYLVHTGGTNNTGPVWMFVIPPVTFAFCGLFAGVFYNVFFLIIMMGLFFLTPDIYQEAEYSTDFKIRISITYALTLTLSGFYEYVRRRSFFEINTLSARYKAQSVEDQLTGLYNRRGFMSHLEQEYRLMKQKQDQMSLLLCDIDYFKSINDRFGHNMGDIVLQHVANVIKNSIRANDIAARWGGEEFILLLPHTALEHATSLAEKIRLAIKETPFSDGQHTVDVTISIGVSCIDAKCSPEEAIRVADNFLYTAKEYGRDKVIGTAIE